MVGNSEVCGWGVGQVLHGIGGVADGPELVLPDALGERLRRSRALAQDREAVAAERSRSPVFDPSAHLRSWKVVAWREPKSPVAWRNSRSDDFQEGVVAVKPVVASESSGSPGRRKRDQPCDLAGPMSVHADEELPGSRSLDRTARAVRQAGSRTTIRPQLIYSGALLQVLLKFRVDGVARAGHQRLTSLGRPGTLGPVRSVDEG